MIIARIYKSCYDKWQLDCWMNGSAWLQPLTVFRSHLYCVRSSKVGWQVAKRTRALRCKGGCLDGKVNDLGFLQIPVTCPNPGNWCTLRHKFRMCQTFDFLGSIKSISINAWFFLTSTTLDRCHRTFFVFYQGTWHAVEVVSDHPRAMRTPRKPRQHRTLPQRKQHRCYWENALQ